MKRARNRAVRTKEGKQTEKKKEKKVFSTRRPLRRPLQRNAVCEISLPCLHPFTLLLLSLPPRWVYIGWVEMWDVDGAIELTMVDEFINWAALGACPVLRLPSAFQLGRPSRVPTRFEKQGSWDLQFGETGGPFCFSRVL